jgi:hypothetical protein
VGVEIVLEQMVRRHLVLLAAFFVQPRPPALALRVIVLDVHVQRGRDPGEAVPNRWITLLENLRTASRVADSAMMAFWPETFSTAQALYII